MCRLGVVQRPFEKGKLGMKLEKEDINNFIREFFKRSSQS